MATQYFILKSLYYIILLSPAHPRIVCHMPILVSVLVCIILLCCVFTGQNLCSVANSIFCITLSFSFSFFDVLFPFKSNIYLHGQLFICIGKRLKLFYVIKINLITQLIKINYCAIIIKVLLNVIISLDVDSAVYKRWVKDSNPRRTESCIKFLMLFYSCVQQSVVRTYY